MIYILILPEFKHTEIKILNDYSYIFEMLNSTLENATLNSFIL